MLFKFAAVASLAILSMMSYVSAQSLSGPAERPPADFRGAQYVDSKGCVYLRAGVGGQINWVARISRNRQALCGFPPTFGNNQVVIRDEPAPQVAAQASPAPRAVAADVGTSVGSSRRPIDTIASLRTPPRVMAKPRATAPVVSGYVPAVPAAPARAVAQADAPQRLANGCPGDAPYGQRVQYVDGRAGLICSPDQSSLTAHLAGRSDIVRAAAPEIRPKRSGSRSVTAGNAVVCPESAPIARRYAYQEGGSTVMCTSKDGDFASATPPMMYGTGGGAAGFVVPKGYKKAWTDDRLNPHRALGTAEGQAQQDRVWTREVPAKAAAAPVTRRVYVASSSNRTRATANPAPQPASGYYVQVGTFGVASNAQGAGARLQKLGMPVAASRINRGGKTMQIVMAGPFGSASQAQAALSAARRAGFGDAFIK
jgi:hypothetical protein